VTPAEIQQLLQAKRRDLADFEFSHHEAKVQAFFMARDAKTVKEMEYMADHASLSLWREVLSLRAEVRSLEDLLKVALHNGRT
jgi:hypothetical protein